MVGIRDQQQLIVPVTWFLEKAFQNWTRTSVELLCFLQREHPEATPRVRLMRGAVAGQPAPEA